MIKVLGKRERAAGDLGATAASMDLFPEFVTQDPSAHLGLFFVQERRSGGGIALLSLILWPLISSFLTFVVSFFIVFFYSTFRISFSWRMSFPCLVKSLTSSSSLLGTKNRGQSFAEHLLCKWRTCLSGDFGVVRNAGKDRKWSGHHDPCLQKLG